VRVSSFVNPAKNQLTFLCHNWLLTSVTRLIFFQDGGNLFAFFFDFQVQYLSCSKLSEQNIIKIANTGNRQSTKIGSFLPRSSPLTFLYSVFCKMSNNTWLSTSLILSTLCSEVFFICLQISESQSLENTVEFGIMRNSFSHGVAFPFLLVRTVMWFVGGWCCRKS